MVLVADCWHRRVCSPALAAIEAGKDLAVASKEILVMAGEIVMREAHDRRRPCVAGGFSEHNAIFQCLEGKRSTPTCTRDVQIRQFNVER